MADIYVSVVRLPYDSEKEWPKAQAMREFDEVVEAQRFPTFGKHIFSFVMDDSI